MTTQSAWTSLNQTICAAHLYSPFVRTTAIETHDGTPIDDGSVVNALPIVTHFDRYQDNAAVLGTNAITATPEVMLFWDELLQEAHVPSYRTNSYPLAYLDRYALSGFVESTVSYAALCALFTASPDRRLVVIRGDQLVGGCRIQNLLRPAGVLCLFAAVQHLEYAAIRLCRFHAKEAFTTLSPARQSKAEEQYERDGAKLPNAPDLLRDIYVVQRRSPRARANEITESIVERDRFHRLIAATTFADKSTMIRKAKLMLSQSQTHIKSVFARAEALRNWCAHYHGMNTTAELALEHIQAATDAHQLAELIEEQLELEFGPPAPDGRREDGSSGEP